MRNHLIILAISIFSLNAISQTAEQVNAFIKAKHIPIKCSIESVDNTKKIQVIQKYIKEKHLKLNNSGIEYYSSGYEFLKTQISIRINELCVHAPKRPKHSVSSIPVVPTPSDKKIPTDDKNVVTQVKKDGPVINDPKSLPPITKGPVDTTPRSGSAQQQAPGSTVNVGSGSSGVPSYSALDGSRIVTVSDRTGDYKIDGKNVYKIEDGVSVKLSKEEAKKVLDTKLAEYDAKKIGDDKLTEDLKSKDENIKRKAQKELKAKLKAEERKKQEKIEAEEQALLDGIERDFTDLRKRIQDVYHEYDTRMQSSPQPSLDYATMLHFKTECHAAFEAANTLDEPVQKLMSKGEKCKSSGSVAKFICPITNNSFVQKASMYMGMGASYLSTSTSAYETCDVTQKINKAGQGLMLMGALTCSVSKGICETSCGNSEKAANTILGRTKKEGVIISDLKIKKLIDACNDENDGKDNIQKLSAKFFDDVAAVSANAEEEHNVCTGYSEENNKMISMAATMLTASAQAGKCVQQLSSQAGGSGGSATLSTEQMCATPEQAVTLLCKCRNDNTAVGCSGYMAGSKNEGNLNKDVMGKGAAGMASLSFGKKITPTAGPSSDTDLDGLSDEAKKALEANADSKTDPLFGVAAGSGGSGGGGGGGTAAGAGAAAGSEKLKEDPKSFGSSFMNAVGSLFGKGGSLGGSAKGATSKTDSIAADKYNEKIKRQIAAEQMRSEISSASGVDNWSKIKSRYKSTSGSLIDNN